jgi:hypothetical protein
MMARILASGASLGPSWLIGLCVLVVSVWVVSFAVFLCSHSHDDDDDDEDRPKKNATIRGTMADAAAEGAVEGVMDAVAENMAAAARGAWFPQWSCSDCCQEQWWLD